MDAMVTAKLSEVQQKIEALNAALDEMMSPAQKSMVKELKELKGQRAGILEGALPDGGEINDGHTVFQRVATHHYGLSNQLKKENPAIMKDLTENYSSTLLISAPDLAFYMKAKGIDKGSAEKLREQMTVKVDFKVTTKKFKARE